MATSTRKRTVTFYEVFDAKGNHIEKPLPWDEMLAQLASQTTNEREHLLWATPHWASAYPFLDRDHLVLARSRDEAPPSLNRVTGEFIDHENDIKQPWVEISIASFIPDTNKFGYVLGSQASPRISALAEWINKHDLFDDAITIGPAINPDILARLNGAAEARLLHVKLDRGQVRSNALVNHGMYEAARALSSNYGDIDIELVIRVSGRANRSHESERIGILDAAKGILAADFKTAVAELVNFDDQGRAHTEHVNLLQDRLAKKMDISVTDSEGNPVRIQSAITAIYRATEELRSSLLQR